jgi:hypothetical protein
MKQYLTKKAMQDLRIIPSAPLDCFSLA